MDFAALNRLDLNAPGGPTEERGGGRAEGRGLPSGDAAQRRHRRVTAGPGRRQKG